MSYNKILFLTIIISVKAVRDKCESDWFCSFSVDSCSSNTSVCVPKRKWKKQCRPVKQPCPDFNRYSESYQCVPCNPYVSCFPPEPLRWYKGRKVRCNPIFLELDRLSRLKEEELMFMFAGFTKKALKDSAALLKSLQTSLNNAINNEYTNLGKSVLSNIEEAETANETALKALIKNSNASLQTGIQGLVTTANTALAQLATDVINGVIPVAQLPAAIVVIMNALSNGVNVLITQVQTQEISNMLNLLSASTVALNSNVSGVLSTSNTSLKKKLNQVLTAEFGTYSVALEKQYAELLESVMHLFHNYACEVKRLFLRSLSGLSNVGSNPLCQQEGY